MAFIKIAGCEGGVLWGLMCPLLFSCNEILGQLKRDPLTFFYKLTVSHTKKGVISRKMELMVLSLTHWRTKKNFQTM